MECMRTRLHMRMASIITAWHHDALPTSAFEQKKALSGWPAALKSPHTDDSSSLSVRVGSQDSLGSFQLSGVRGTW